MISNLNLDDKNLKSETWNIFECLFSANIFKEIIIAQKYYNNIIYNSPSLWFVAYLEMRLFYYIIIILLYINDYI